MRYIIVMIFTALILTGCAGGIKNPFTSNNINTLNAAYATVVAVAANYRDACARRVIHNSCRLIVPKMQDYLRKADFAVKQARRFVDENPTINPASAIWAANKAIGDLKDFQAAQGVN